MHQLRIGPVDVLRLTLVNLQHMKSVLGRITPLWESFPVASVSF